MRPDFLLIEAQRRASNFARPEKALLPDHTRSDPSRFHHPQPRLDSTRSRADNSQQSQLVSNI
ncbi:hypothetical protein RRF57_008488 [Xylaria bambusicola]|uniref:Uncharacterized protein n=1 Tax=Xylaria bambusicola TaxID=326684 RepID=A0AAN7UY48_9PEZI